MEHSGMEVGVDAAGNIRGPLKGKSQKPRRLLIGSHLDTVPNAGAFDGIIGVIIGITLAEPLAGQKLNNTLEIIGFSEEAVRFGIPFIGSRAVTGSLTDEIMKRTDERGVTLEEAIRSFGLDPGQITKAQLCDDAQGYLEFHIEQRSVLEQRGTLVGVVNVIVGQRRLEFVFEGIPGHAGTTGRSLIRHSRKDRFTEGRSSLSIY